MSLNDKIEEANKSEFKGGDGGWFKMKEGLNQFRVLNEPEVIFENFGRGICYHECGYEGTPKYLTRILDRTDGKVKMYKLPFSVFENIAGFEQDDELAFTGFPMPYDVKINAVNAGTKEVKYTVMPSIKRVDIDEDTKEYLKTQKPIKEVIEALQAKNIEKHKADGSWQEQQKKIADLRESLKNDLKNGVKSENSIAYPTEDISEEDIPF